MRKDDEKHYDYTDYSDDPANNYFDENGDPILENINEIDYAEPEEEYHETRSSNRKKHPFWHGVGQVIKWLMILFMIGIVSGIGVFAYYAKDSPTITTNKMQSGGSSALYTNDGKLLLSLGSDKRAYLRNDKIPQQLKDAVVSVEDKRFYSEPLGIDPLRIAASFISNIRGHDISAGGSGITQQLVKLSVFSTDASQRTLRRKAQEAWLAMQVTRHYSKDQILEFYINKVYMGYNNYGIGTASTYYFGKPISKIDLAQTALLAGLLNAPTSYDPYLYPKAATYRRNIVLQAMLNNKKITQEQYQQAINEPIQDGLRPRHNSDSANQTRKIDDPYIKEVVNEARAKGFDPYTSNLKITINIDQKAQNKLYELANSKEIPFTENKMQVGSTIVDPNTGHVVAIIGGRHLPDNVQLGLNRAVQTGRSTGSSIKPLLDYAPAIQYLNWSTAQTLDDTPYVYQGTSIQLYDWDNRYLGPMTMRYALEQSRNVPAVRTLEAVGLQKASSSVKKMGINIEKNQGLSVGIGANASSLQLAGAYSALSNNGIYHKPTFISKIETPDGVVRNYDDPGTRVMRAGTAYMVTDMLRGVITRGSGTQAQIRNLYQAGKTGTVKYSDDELKNYPSYRNTPKDSWFVGYTRSYVMSVWTGYDNLSEGNIKGNGQNAAQLLYKNMMSYLMEDRSNLNWDKPDDVVKRQIGRTTELYVKGHAPKVQKAERKDSVSRRATRGNSNNVINQPNSNQNQLQRHVIVRRIGDRLYYYYYYTRR